MNFDELVLIGDDSGAALARAVREARSRGGGAADAYTGADYAELPTGLQALATAEVARQVTEWAARWADALEWADGERDSFGRGWEGLARDWAWTVACLAAARWSPLDEEGGDMLHDLGLPDAVAGARGCRGKWTEGLIVKAAGYLAAPWPAEFAVPDPPGHPDDPPPPPGRAIVDVSNPANALIWLQGVIGTGPLSGMFRREREVVFTARIGERGYREAREGEYLGPAQVHPIKPLELAARLDSAYRVVKRTRTRITPSLFPTEVASRALSKPDMLPNLRWLRGVTHTPVIRPDGSLLDRPGYDDLTGVLYLPVPGLSVPPVPDQPTARQVDRASELIMEMLVDFPFITPVDKANYIGGALFTPLLRSMFPPPYKLMGIGAPQPGSGKSLLAACSRTLHGGVFKSEFPSPEEEVRKFITTVLSQTTAPVVQFDNVSGVLRSSSLEGLLTSPEWADRRLGETGMIVMPNDRVWVLTGNNLRIAGDLGRRVLWSRINVGAPHPELRTGFHIEELEPWVLEHRGELLAALLTLVRSWVTDGGPVGRKVESSGYGVWLTGLRGIVDHAGFGPSVGAVAETGTAEVEVDGDSTELGVLLVAIYRVFGWEKWTAGDVLARVDMFDEGEVPGEGKISQDELPEVVAEKVGRSGAESAARRVFGKWLDVREGRWADQLSTKKIGLTRAGIMQWRLVGPK